MQAKQFFWVVGCGLFAMIMLTDPPVAAPGPRAQATAAADASAPRAETPRSVQHVDSMTGQVVLDRQADGHFYARPTIGYNEVAVLVDTGASIVALTGEDADRAGIAWSRADLRPIGEGASGEVEGVPVMLDRVELGGLVAHDVAAAVIPDGLGVTLLGQSFLRRVGKVEIVGETMVLSGS